jgi:hypothetical protein
MAEAVTYPVVVGVGGGAKYSPKFAPYIFILPPWTATRVVEAATKP